MRKQRTVERSSDFESAIVPDKPFGRQRGDFRTHCAQRDQRRLDFRSGQQRHQHARNRNEHASKVYLDCGQASRTCEIDALGKHFLTAAMRGPEVKRAQMRKPWKNMGNHAVSRTTLRTLLATHDARYLLCACLRPARYRTAMPAALIFCLNSSSVYASSSASRLDQ